MGVKIQAVKGMNDILPVAVKDSVWTSDDWLAFEAIAHKWLKLYGYKHIRTPMIEPTHLFVRSIGEETDVVGKEMYTFDDYGESLSLRPEGTASCLRAVVEHNLLYNSPQKLWYMGAMFRHEKPQKGRYRQFHQIGVEALGYAGADTDAEIIAMCWDLWQKLGIKDCVQLEINCLGNREERAAHRTALVAYLQQNEHILDEDSRRRMTTNPLRVLDSKNPALQAMIENAPKLSDYLKEGSLKHYHALKNILKALNIPFVENHRLVRGLDYYNATVFEWTTDKLGAQGTICGGGRYDGLIEELGGKATPSIGFAIGIERLLLLVKSHGVLKSDNSPDIYAMYQGETAQPHLMRAVQNLRHAGFSVLTHGADQKLGTQFKKADASGAKFALIVAENEVNSGSLTLKNLTTGEQVSLSPNEVINQLNQWSI
ncbi:MAG: histidine--tRNA ligase [Neisseriaceae bacterium]|nr:histidine--tRNA ligase [Neisseriaceae bacterium]